MNKVVGTGIGALAGWVLGSIISLIVLYVVIALYSPANLPNFVNVIWMNLLNIWFSTNVWLMTLIFYVIVVVMAYIGFRMSE